jgi:hypothetical protein
VRPAIGLSEALHVFEAFAPADHARALHMLGLSVEADTPAVVASVDQPAIVPRQPPRAIEKKADDALARPRESVRVFADNDVLVLPEPRATTVPAWFRDAIPLPVEPSSDAQRVKLDPLFTPAWQRAIAVSALSANVASGAIDVDRVVERFAQALPLERLPLMSRRSLQAGAQIVIDTSEAMRPFFGDLDHMIDVVRALYPAERLTIVACDDGPPLFAGHEPAYVPPASGTSVLILSHFGIASRRDAAMGGTTKAWCTFAVALRRRGHKVMAFAPTDLRRLPASLRRTLPTVRWDRVTGTAAVTRARTMAESAG